MSSSGLHLKDLLIPLEEIRSATKEFSDETLIGRSGIGRVYKGQFTERFQNCTAAVKRFNTGPYFNGRKAFLNELNLISKFHHENIILFIGYCDEGDEMIIVYKYATKGSLKDHLEKPYKRLSMTWPQRLKICLGAAKAINYLHLGLSEDYVVLHRNFSSGKILLDENLEAKVYSFGRAREVSRNQQHIYESINVCNNYSNHVDPIYTESGILNKEVDVYSLGVVMFELLSGTPTYTRMKKISH